jgi:hypothetical protein
MPVHDVSLVALSGKEQQVQLEVKRDGLRLLSAAGKVRRPGAVEFRRCRRGARGRGTARRPSFLLNDVH